MKWWLLAEPKDQDFTHGLGPVARDGLPNNRRCSRVLVEAYLLVLFKFEEDWNNGVVNFTKIFLELED